MELSKTVFRSSESWNKKLLEESLLNVALYLMKKNFKSIKLRVLVPYRKKKRFYSSTEEIIQAEKESTNLGYAANFYSAEVTELVVQMLNKVIKNNADKFKVVPSYRQLVTAMYPIYDEDTVGSITKMFASIEEDIDAGKEEDAHVIYIIDSSLVKGIPYESGIPFVNYVVC